MPSKVSGELGTLEVWEWMSSFIPHFLTHWGRVTHICVSKLTIIGSDNGLSPGRCQAIIWTNAGILFIGSLWTNFSEILIEILTFSFKKMLLKLSSAKWRPFCLGLNVLMNVITHAGIKVNPCSEKRSLVNTLGIFKSVWSYSTFYNNTVWQSPRNFPRHWHPYTNICWNQIPQDASSLCDLAEDTGVTMAIQSLGD